MLLGVATACLAGPLPSWPVRHADIRNTDVTTGRAANRLEPAWALAPDIPIGTFVAIGSNGLLYTHSYNAPDRPLGAHAGCRLWAIEARTGAVRWCRKEVGAALTSIALGPANDVFVADRTTLWRFHAAGRRIWQRPIPSETSALTWSAEGLLLVADYAGGIRLYDPETGTPRSDAFRLPAAPYPRGPLTADQAPGQLQAGVGADYLPHLLDNFFGYGVVIKDMPVVAPGTGRLFVAGNSPSGSGGLLFGIDVERQSRTMRRLRLACTVETGPNSDTSPAVTSNGRTLYTAAAGFLFAVDTQSCQVKWRVPKPGVAAASPTLLADGRVILMAGGTISAFRDVGRTAQALWSLEAADQARAEGFEDGRFNSVVVGVGQRLYVAATFGPAPNGIPFPSAHRLFVIDAQTGKVVSTAALGAESDSTPSISSDGWVYVPTKSLAHAHWISERLLGRLPSDLSQRSLPAPRNGIYAFKPVP